MTRQPIGNLGLADVRESLRSFRRELGLGLALLALYALVASQTSPRWLLWLAEQNPAWTLAVLVAVYTVRPLLAIPPTPLHLFVAYLYGLPAVLLVHAGTILTAAVPFLLVRRGWHAGTDTPDVERARLSTLSGKLAFGVVPIPLDIKAIGAAIANVPLRTYLLAMALGAVPWSIALTLSGWSLKQYSVSAAADLGWLVLATAILSAFLAAPTLYRWLSDGR